MRIPRFAVFTGFSGVKVAATKLSVSILRAQAFSRIEI